MIRKIAVTIALALTASACTIDAPTEAEPPALDGSTPSLAAMGSEGLTRKSMPDEDPGPPFYARATTILDQLFHTDGWLAIPFYRPPSCVPEDFNVLQLFDFPGPGGPGAFACPLLMDGFILIEPDAPLGTFPRQAIFTGDAVPFWFVPWSDFEAEAADGVVTFAELEALDRLTGTADHYHETLKPREGDHLIVIEAEGALSDGRAFQFGVTHREDRTEAIRIRFH